MVITEHSRPSFVLLTYAEYQRLLRTPTDLADWLDGRGGRVRDRAGRLGHPTCERVMYLLDTNVISELRKRRGDSGVKKWVAGQSAADLAVSVVTIIEIENGILRKQRTDPDQARILSRWFENNVLTGFADRILPLDLAAARRVASLHVPDQAPQHDALIAGTALARGLTVVTRNTRDFERAGVEYLNPWSDS